MDAHSYVCADNETVGSKGFRSATIPALQSMFVLCGRNVYEQINSQVMLAAAMRGRVYVHKRSAIFLTVTMC